MTLPQLDPSRRPASKAQGEFFVLQVDPAATLGILVFIACYCHPIDKIRGWLLGNIFLLSLSLLEMRIKEKKLVSLNQLLHLH